MTRTVILAGGRGTRMAGRPKPLVEIAGTPLIEHVIGSFTRYGYQDFLVALGHRHEEVSRELSSPRLMANVDTIDTGRDAGSAERIAALATEMGEGSFLLSYCDCLSDIDLDQFLKFHHAGNALVTVAAVRPRLPWGVLELNGDEAVVRGMVEKPFAPDLWINAGIFAVEPQALPFMCSGGSSWENNILPDLAEAGKLAAFRHHGFWRSVETAKDVLELEELCVTGQAPWLAPARA